jgi:hypothetical protein
MFSFGVLLHLLHAGRLAYMNSPLGAPGGLGGGGFPPGPVLH